MNNYFSHEDLGSEIYICFGYNAIPRKAKILRIVSDHICGQLLHVISQGYRMMRIKDHCYLTKQEAQVECDRLNKDKE